MKPLPLSLLATSLLALPLAAQRPAGPPPAPPVPPPSAPVQAPPLPATTEIQDPPAAPAPPPAPQAHLSLADTDCTVLDEQFRRMAAASQQGHMQLGYNSGSFPYSKIFSYSCHSLEMKCAQIGSGTVRISIDIPEGARNEKNWPQFLKAMGLPADAPQPDPERTPQEGSLWTSPQPGRNWVAVSQPPGAVPQLIIGSRAVYNSVRELAVDEPNAARALEEFDKILGKP